MNLKRFLARLIGCSHADNSVSLVPSYEPIEYPAKLHKLAFRALIVDAQNTIWLVNAAGNVTKLASERDMPQRYSLKTSGLDLTKELFIYSRKDLS